MEYFPKYYPICTKVRSAMHCKVMINDICMIYVTVFNPLSANPTKWSNTLKQFGGNLPTRCLSVFDHVMGLVLKGLSEVRVL